MTNFIPIFPLSIVVYPGESLNLHIFEQGNSEVMQKLMISIRELHRLLSIKKDFIKEESKIKVYEVAHHIGLSLQEEYELLNLVDERQRQEYIKRHLVKVIPMVVQMEQLKEKVKLNGHFKNLTGFNFDL